MAQKMRISNLLLSSCGELEATASQSKTQPISIPTNIKAMKTSPFLITGTSTNDNLYALASNSERVEYVEDSSAVYPSPQSYSYNHQYHPTPSIIPKAFMANSTDQKVQSSYSSQASNISGIMGLGVGLTPDTASSASISCTDGHIRLPSLAHLQFHEQSRSSGGQTSPFVLPSLLSPADTTAPSNSQPSSPNIHNSSCDFGDSHGIMLPKSRNIKHNFPNSMRYNYNNTSTILDQGSSNTIMSPAAVQLKDDNRNIDHRPMHNTSSSSMSHQQMISSRQSNMYMHIPTPQASPRPIHRRHAIIKPAGFMISRPSNLPSLILQNQSSFSNTDGSNDVSYPHVVHPRQVDEYSCSDQDQLDEDDDQSENIRNVSSNNNMIMDSTRSRDNRSKSETSEVSHDPQKKYTTSNTCIARSANQSNSSRLRVKNKPYTCPLPSCPSRFARRFNMIQHFKSHSRRLGVTEKERENAVITLKAAPKGVTPHIAFSL